MTPPKSKKQKDSEYYAAHKEKIKEQTKKWKKANPTKRKAHAKKYKKGKGKALNREHFRWYWIKNKYGLSKEDWYKIFEEQNGCCYICQRTEKQIRRSKSRTLAVDHCHKTGAIRGLLCGYCNTQLSQFLSDSAEKALRAYQYLARTPTHGQVPLNEDRPAYLRNVLEQDVGAGPSDQIDDKEL